MLVKRGSATGERLVNAVWSVYLSKLIYSIRRLTMIMCRIYANRVILI